MKPVGPRVNDVLVRLLLADPEGSAIDYGGDSISQGRGGHGKHGTTSVAPPRFDSMAVQWADFFRRAVELAELDLARMTGEAAQVTHVGSGRVAAGPARDRKRRIVRSELYEGRACEFVAYVEGCSADHVRRTRAERGLDAYGLKERRERALTGRELPESDDDKGEQT